MVVMYECRFEAVMDGFVVVVGFVKPVVVLG